MLALGHHVNLFRPPYCLRDAARLYSEGAVAPDLYLGLWELGTGAGDDDDSAAGGGTAGGTAELLMTSGDLCLR